MAEATGPKDCPKSDWMGLLPSYCHGIPVNQLAIPGSHDSGTYSMNESGSAAPDSTQTIRTLVKVFGCVAKGIVYKWSVTQSFDFTTQLERGIRYFDLRVATNPSDPGHLHIVHGLYGARVMDVLSQISGFLSAHPKEVVLLDFNHFYNCSADILQELAGWIRAAFGSRLCPRRRTASLTLSSMWDAGHQVIAFMHTPLSGETYDLWPGGLCPSPWGNKTKVADQLAFLQGNYDDQRDEATFYVWQGVLTPDTGTIVKHLTGSLKDTLAKEMAQPFVQWVRSKRNGPQGLNVCLADFVERADFVNAVVGLNWRTISVTEASNA